MTYALFVRREKMIELITIIACVISIIILKFAFQIQFKEITKFKNKSNSELDEITKKLPDNEEVCKEILAQLENHSNVAIKQEEESRDCLYMIFNNTILLGRFKADFIRIQTIAHECLHSIQNKATLWFNYIFSNMVLLYFAVISILTLFNKIGNTNAQLVILLIMSAVQYAIRAYLENDAMAKAPYVAKEYLESKQVAPEQIKHLMEEYTQVNSVGVPFTNFQLLCKNIMKVIFYCIFILV